MLYRVRCYVLSILIDKTNKQNWIAIERGIATAKSSLYHAVLSIKSLNLQDYNWIELNWIELNWKNTKWKHVPEIEEVSSSTATPQLHWAVELSIFVVTCTWDEVVDKLSRVADAVLFTVNKGSKEIKPDKWKWTLSVGAYPVITPTSVWIQ